MEPKNEVCIMDDLETPDHIQDFEQEAAELTNVAQLIGHYYQQLKASKVPTLLAQQLVIEYHRTIISGDEPLH